VTRRYSAIFDKLSHLSGIVDQADETSELGRVLDLILRFQKDRADAEIWLGLGVDVKGWIYEGLLERNAQEVKSGAEQYFTPWALIAAMVTVVEPAPGPFPNARTPWVIPS
jgi:type I restriction enzyme M protein